MWFVRNAEESIDICDLIEHQNQQLDKGGGARANRDSMICGGVRGEQDEELPKKNEAMLHAT